MRTLVYHVAASLDGRIAREDGTFDFFLQEGEHVTDFLRSLGRFDTVLMGRATYEVGLRLGVTDPYPALKSYVFSRTLPQSPDRHVELVREDAAGFVRTLKAQAGRDLWLCGGAGLASALFGAHLIDEVIVKLNPVLAGAGIGLLAGGGHRIGLALLESRGYESGVVLLRYGVQIT